MDLAEVGGIAAVVGTGFTLWMLLSKQIDKSEDRNDKAHGEFERHDQGVRRSQRQGSW